MSNTSIPSTMPAMVLMAHGDLDQLQWHQHWPTPIAHAGEALIKVHACGLNNTDVNTRTAWYSKGVSGATTGAGSEEANDDDATWGGAPVQLPRIQGADVVGTVVAVGDGVATALVGRRVLVDTWIRDWDEPMNLDRCGYYGSECDGGFASYAKADHRQVHPIDSALSNEELATFATAYVTAENMLNRAQVGEGDVVLVPGASGGVGSALLQLCRRRGAKTVALANVAKHAQIRDIADVLLPRSPQNLRQSLQQALGRDTVSVLADVVGGSGWSTCLDVIARGGRLTCAGAIAGPMVEFDLRTFYLRDLTFTGATIVPPGVFADIVRYIERSEVKPLLAASYPLNRLRDAQQAFIDKLHVGNIVVTV